MTSKLKTPLRYPGGKSRAIKHFKEQFPKNFGEFREPFLGGGSVALHVTQNYPNVDVWVNDLYFNLYNFWTQLRDNGADLHAELVRIRTPIDFNSKPLRKAKVDRKDWDPHVLKSIEAHRELFMKAKEEINNENVDDFTKAVYFYILNKCSFSGLGESSSFSEMASDQNFNFNGINKLPEYSKLIKNWKITNLDYNELLTEPANDDCFIFLDPPYDIKDNLYGKNGDKHKGFDHVLFYEGVSSCKHDWMITYNSNEILKERFSKYILTDWDLTYTMRSTGDYSKDQKKRQELLIRNYEVNV